MTERRSVHRTQWASQFAVASELCKRNYQVAFTMGNHPSVDLMVISPQDHAFKIDVKGLYKKNYWGVAPKKEAPDLFYVFAFVPDNEPNEFFIMDQSSVNREVRRHIEDIRNRRTAKGLSTEKVERFPGLPWDLVKSHRDRWDILPR